MKGNLYDHRCCNCREWVGTWVDVFCDKWLCKTCSGDIENHLVTRRRKDLETELMPMALEVDTLIGAVRELTMAVGAIEMKLHVLLDKPE